MFLCANIFIYALDSYHAPHFVFHWVHSLHSSFSTQLQPISVYEALSSNSTYWELFMPKWKLLLTCFSMILFYVSLKHLFEIHVFSLFNWKSVHLVENYLYFVPCVLKIFSSKGSSFILVLFLVFVSSNLVYHFANFFT